MAQIQRPHYQSYYADLSREKQEKLDYLEQFTMEELLLQVKEMQREQKEEEAQKQKSQVLEELGESSTRTKATENPTKKAKKSKRERKRDQRKKEEVVANDTGIKETTCEAIKSSVNSLDNRDSEVINNPNVLAKCGKTKVSDTLKKNVSDRVCQFFLTFGRCQRKICEFKHAKPAALSSDGYILFSDQP